MTDQIQFELTAPEKMVFNKPVAMITVPAGAGACSVLIGHAPMVTDVVAGVVDIYENDQETISQRIFVTGGYCEVTTERCSLMADDILDLESFDSTAIEAEMAALVEERNAADDEEGRAKVDVKIAIVQAKHLAVTLG